MPMTENFSAFFNTNEHATAAIYNAVTINGVFEDRFVEINGHESARPTFLCAEADVAGVAHGDAITINAIIYTINGTEPDGTGTILLILSNP